MYAQQQRLKSLRAAVQTRPEDLPATLELAREYLDLGRTRADPRFISYAQATLEPWVARADPPAEALVLAGMALQYLHRFDAALSVLASALEREPGNAQAWLVKATILQVQGRFPEARNACRPLARTAGQLIAIACLSEIQSLTGHLETSYDALREVFLDDPRLGTAVRTWIRASLADMALRRGDRRAAEGHLRAALALAPQDPGLRSDYADLLLLENRNSEVLSVLKEGEAQDNLLLRLAIAGHRLGDPHAAGWSAAFAARCEIALRARDLTHARELARFLLEVRADAARALALAAQNWRIQKEPADVRVYWQAAHAAHDQAAIHVIDEWMRNTGYQDRQIPGANVGDVPESGS